MPQLGRRACPPGCRRILSADAHRFARKSSGKFRGRPSSARRRFLVAGRQDRRTPTRPTTSSSWAAASADWRPRISTAPGNADARILILDNHDDFGGHAKRNEFELGGRLALINGGTMGIDSPRPYSVVADGLLKALGVDPVALAKSARTARFTRHSASSGVCSSTGKPLVPISSSLSPANFRRPQLLAQTPFVAAGPERHRQDRGSGYRLSFRPVVGCKEIPIVQDELS